MCNVNAAKKVNWFIMIYSYDFKDKRDSEFRLNQMIYSTNKKGLYIPCFFSRKINGIKPSNSIYEAFLKRTTSLFSFEDFLLKNRQKKPYHFSY